MAEIENPTTIFGYPVELVDNDSAPAIQVEFGDLAAYILRIDKTPNKDAQNLTLNQKTHII